MSLEDKVALVTGAGRGLGQAVSSELAGAGVHVFVTDLEQTAAEASIQQIREQAGEAAERLQLTPLGCDVRNESDIQAVMDAIERATGKLDVLINNAGVNVTATTETLSIEDWDRIVGTNLRGAFIMSKLALPLMKKAGSGNIINVVSSLAKRIKENSPAYVASKWGLLGYSQLLFMEARKYNIKVTAFSPAGMRTRLVLDRFPDLDQSRLQDPATVAKIIRFILELPDDVAIADIFTISLKEETWP